MIERNRLDEGVRLLHQTFLKTSTGGDSPST
jgi:hypothetical protein